MQDSDAFKWYSGLVGYVADLRSDSVGSILRIANFFIFTQKYFKFFHTTSLALQALFLEANACSVDTA